MFFVHDDKTNNMVTKFTCSEDIHVHSKENEKQPLLADNTGKLTSPLKSGIAENIPLLFVDSMWKVTFILSILWFGAAWLYYGNVLLTTTLFQYNPHTNDYIKIMWAACAELPGMLVTIVIDH